MKGFLRALKSQNIKMLKKKKGVALPYVIVVGTCLFVLVTTLFAVSVSDNVVFSERYNQRQAYITAKSVIEYSKAVLTDDMSSESKSEPTSFIVTANKENGRITSYSYDNNASYSAFTTEQLEQRVKTNNAIGYCYVKKSLTEQDTYEITIKAIVDYKGAGGSTKTEVLTYQGLRCIYTPGENKTDAYDTSKFNFTGKIQTDNGNINSIFEIDDNDAKEYIFGTNKSGKNRMTISDGAYDIDLTDATYFNSKNPPSRTMQLQGSAQAPLKIEVGTTGVTVFELQNDFLVHQANSDSYFHGRVMYFRKKTNIESDFTMQATDWINFVDGLAGRSTMGSTKSANINIEGQDSSKDTFAVFQGSASLSDWTKSSIMMENSAMVKVSNFDYIWLKKTVNGSGGIFINGNFLDPWNIAYSNTCTLMANKAAIIDGDITCSKSYFTAQTNVTINAQDYIKIKGNVGDAWGNSGIITVKAYNDKTNTYGPVYCNYTANTTENGVPVYQVKDFNGNATVTIYNPKPLSQAPADPTLPDFDNDLNPGSTGKSSSATKTFEGGTYN